MKAKDLAKKLGVSPATISLVLNNKPGISDSLRQSLLEKIQELGHEEMIAPSCRAGMEPGENPEPKPQAPCRSIAYLIYEDHDYINDMKDPYNFFSEVLEGVEYEAWEHDCCLMMVHMNRHKNISLQERLRRAGNNVIGAIVHPCCLSDRVKNDARTSGIPFVFMDRYGTGGWEPSSVCISNRQGMYNALKYLMAMGHSRVGYVASGWEGKLNLERRFWFRRVLGELGLKFSEEDFFCAGEEEGLFDYTRLAELFRQAESLPTALICENDRQAWRSIMALKLAGKRVPEDVSVVGFDDQQICTTIQPNITSVHNSPHLMGRECVMLLHNLLALREREEEPWLRYELPARLVVRDSVADISGNASL